MRFVVAASLCKQNLFFISSSVKLILIINSFASFLAPCCVRYCYCFSGTFSFVFFLRYSSSFAKGVFVLCVFRKRSFWYWIANYDIHCMLVVDFLLMFLCSLQLPLFRRQRVHRTRCNLVTRPLTCGCRVFTSLGFFGMRNVAVRRYCS